MLAANAMLLCIRAEYAAKPEVINMVSSCLDLLIQVEASDQLPSAFSWRIFVLSGRKMRYAEPNASLGFDINT